MQSTFLAYSVTPDDRIKVFNSGGEVKRYAGTRRSARETHSFAPKAINPNLQRSVAFRFGGWTRRANSDEKSDGA
jgi:hypothetical protein